MNCCQNIIAHVGYAQNDEWHVVMISQEHILCECHSRQSTFSMKSPFTWEEWKKQWRQCEQRFLGCNKKVRWDFEVDQIVQDKTYKIVKGNVVNET